MIEKRLKRRRRATKTRARIREQGVARLCVGRTVKHLYAQVITEAPKGDQVLASASTLEKAVKARVSEAVSEEAGVLPAAFNNVRSAGIIGSVIAERALALGITRVAFDRSGFKYHGRVKALAEAARKAGLNF